MKISCMTFVRKRASYFEILKNIEKFPSLSTLWETQKQNKYQPFWHEYIHEILLSHKCVSGQYDGSGIAKSSLKVLKFWNFKITWVRTRDGRWGNTFLDPLNSNKWLLSSTEVFSWKRLQAKFVDYVKKEYFTNL